MKKVTFIHAADLHLDSPMLGAKGIPARIFQRLKESTFRAVTAIIDEAIHHQCDFVIFAGDLFDQETRSIKAQVFLKKELERLAQHGIDAFIVFGNHDFFTDQHTIVSMPENTHIFAENVEVKTFTAKNNTIVHLYGFSYEKRHIVERKIDDYKKEPGAHLHIGILHGNLEGQSDHSNYAPFHLQDLIEKNFHYWALGHIHKRQKISLDPPIIYPGNTQGRNRKETGMKGCYLVNLTEHKANLRFIETSDVIWEEAVIDCKDVKDFNDLIIVCENELSSLRIEGKGILLHLQLINLPWSYSNKTKLDLLEALQEIEGEEESFVWPINIELETALNSSREELIHQSEFFEELFRVFDESEDIDEMLAPLYEHSSARRYLSALTEEEKQLLKKEAEKLLIEQLYKH